MKSETNLRKAFTNIRQDMNNLKRTLALQRTFLEKRVHNTHDAIMSSVEKKFFNGHSYVTQKEFNHYIDELITQIGPVQAGLGRLAAIEEEIARIDSITSSFEKERESFITEKNVSFLIDTIQEQVDSIGEKTVEIDKMKESMKSIKETVKKSVRREVMDKKLYLLNEKVIRHEKTAKDVESLNAKFQILQKELLSTKKAVFLLEKKASEKNKLIKNLKNQMKKMMRSLSKA